LYEAARQEGEVALWANTFSDATKVLKPFHDKYPGVKVKVWDASTGDDVINKLVEEGKVGRVTGDIFFSGEGDLVKAVTAGLMQEHDWGTEGWPNQPPNKFYINYGTNPRLPVFNTNVIPVAEGPKSWEDLALPKWRDKGPVASFSGSTLTMLMAHMWREKEGELNWEKAEKYFTDVVENTKPKVVRGFSGPMELLVTGEYGIFVPVASGRRVMFYSLIGAPVSIVPVGKTPGITQAMGIVKNAAHPNAARLFANWYAKEGGALSKIQGDLIYTLDPELVDVARANILLRDRYNTEVEPVPTKFFSAENVDRATDFHLKVLGVK
jgi:iron(III) transport system substrate-binding protein